MNKIIYVGRDKAAVIFNRDIDIESIFKAGEENIKNFRNTSIYNNCKTDYRGHLVCNKEKELRETFLNFKLKGTFTSRSVKGKDEVFEFEICLDNPKPFIDEKDNKKGIIFDLKSAMLGFKTKWYGDVCLNTDITHSSHFKINNMQLELPNHNILTSVFKNFSLNIDEDSFSVLLPSERSDDLYHMPVGFNKQVFSLTAGQVFSLTTGFGYDVTGDLVFDTESKGKDFYWINVLSNTITKINN